jgi:hypothetical protein
MNSPHENEIENWLRQSRAEPRPEFRDRVLTAASAELTRPPERRSGVHHWKVAAATVAASVLWLHASWSAVLNTRWETGAPTAGQLQTAAAQIHDLVPDLPASETRRLAFVLEAGIFPLSPDPGEVGSLRDW